VAIVGKLFNDVAEGFLTVSGLRAKPSAHDSLLAISNRLWSK